MSSSHKALFALLALLASGWIAPAAAQDAHAHTPGVSGLPQGVPLFCASPTVSSVRSGAWSDSATWSTRRVPAADDKVMIASGHAVLYDAVSDALLGCVEIAGTLTFKRDASTRMRVVTLTVLEGGALELGSPAAPLLPAATAEIVIADRPFDPAIDPSQAGHGLISFGRVTFHGAVKSPTFARVVREPLAGASTLVFDQPVTGWKAGDTIVLPDTRQLRASESGRGYQPQTEKVQIASVSGSSVVLTAPLAYDHKGARDASGTVVFLPHAGNLSRNVVVRSENPEGTRGHVLFSSRADVDIRYAEFRELGRTKIGILNNTETDSEGRVRRIGTNQIGRYAIHFHHTFGPVETPANGHQFTVIGNAVDGSPKWGLVVHRSHYGLIRENVVYNTRGAGIVTEDGTESFNVFEGNFSLRTSGSRDAAPGNGYSSVLPNPGGDGSAFWFRGPNNYIRKNVAASAAESGFGLPARLLGTIRVPKYKGAESSRSSESLALDSEQASVLEFSDNEAYGAIQSGVGWAWGGTIANLKVWHASKNGVTASPTEKFAIDRLIVRGDPGLLDKPEEAPAGVWVANYAALSVTIKNADVEGTRVGVVSPFFYGQSAEANRPGVLAVEHSVFRTQVGIAVATGYRDDAVNGVPMKRAIVRGVKFSPLAVPTPGGTAPEAISMNYGMRASDARPRQPLDVYDFGQQAGRDFQVYYSLDASAEAAPCRDTMPGIGGWVCRTK